MRAEFPQRPLSSNCSLRIPSTLEREAASIGQLLPFNSSMRYPPTRFPNVRPCVKGALLFQSATAISLRNYVGPPM